MVDFSLLLLVLDIVVVRPVQCVCFTSNGGRFESKTTLHKNNVQKRYLENE